MYAVPSHSREWGRSGHAIPVVDAFAEGNLLRGAGLYVAFLAWWS